ncbi:MAG: tetratricopeptide repeat protein [Chitinophagales bacterium]|nr:tetratricopeptide repeat protein [Chitinophagales bacterium]
MSDLRKQNKKSGPDLSVEETKEQLFGQHSDAIKKKVDESEFYRSAFEGLKSVPDAEAFESAINDIQKNISKQSGYHTAQEIKLNRKKWLIAASIAFALITLGSILFVNIGNDTAVSENSPQVKTNKTNSALEKAKSNPKIIPVEEAESEDQISDIEEETSEPETNSQESSSTNQEAAISNENSPIVQESGTELIAKDETADNTPEEKFDIAETDDAVAAQEESVDYYSNTSAPAAAEINNSTVRSATSMSADISTSEKESLNNSRQNESISTSVTIESAMSLYNSGDYKAALDQFDALLKAYPGNRKANYYAGVSYMNIGKSTKAIDHFDELITSEGTTYKDSSKWLKAKILVKKGKKNEAKQLLEDLSQRQNRYAQQAKDLLQSL